METTPWEVNGKFVSDGYIAGFLDGDGSIGVHHEQLFAMAKEIRNLNSGAGGKKSYELINPLTTQI